MAVVPAHCDHCELTWEPARGIVMEGPGTVNVTVVGGGTNCPRCGRAARFLDGAFEYRAEVVRVLSAPAWTHEKLSALRASLQAALDRLPGDSEAAVAEVAAVDYRVGGLLARAVARGLGPAEVIALVSLLVTIIFGILALVPKGAETFRIDPGQLQQLVDELDVRDSTPAPRPTEPGSRAPRTVDSPSPPLPPPAAP